MNNTRRKFFKQSLAGALLLGTSAMSHAEEKSRIIPKAPKSVNPFQLGMAGYTFVNFDLDIFAKFLSQIFKCNVIHSS